MSWFVNNSEWFFSGLGVLCITVLFKLFKSLTRGKTTSQQVSPQTLPALNQNVVINNNVSSESPSISKPKVLEVRTLVSCKESTRILFIDDDAKFKVVQILKNSGWVHTKTIKDVKSLDCPEIVEASILFVDIQGVGKQLGFSDEGLGLADAIKMKYPEKSVVIYSAETKGDRFHKALRNMDSFLPKNADPYEFQQIVEEYALGKQIK